MRGGGVAAAGGGVVAGTWAVAGKQVDRQAVAAARGGCSGSGGDSSFSRCCSSWELLQLQPPLQQLGAVAASAAAAASRSRHRSSSSPLPGARMPVPSRPPPRARRQHIHMNSTKWLTLTEFIKYLGKLGKVKVDETPKGWYIAVVHRNEAEARQGGGRSRDLGKEGGTQGLWYIVVAHIDEAEARGGRGLCDMDLGEEGKCRGWCTLLVKRNAAGARGPASPVACGRPRRAAPSGGAAGAPSRAEGHLATIAPCLSLSRGSRPPPPPLPPPHPPTHRLPPSAGAGGDEVCGARAP